MKFNYLDRNILMPKKDDAGAGTASKGKEAMQNGALIAGGYLLEKFGDTILSKVVDGVVDIVGNLPLYQSTDREIEFEDAIGQLIIPDNDLPVSEEIYALGTSLKGYSDPFKRYEIGAKKMRVWFADECWVDTDIHYDLKNAEGDVTEGIPILYLGFSDLVELHNSYSGKDSNYIDAEHAKEIVSMAQSRRLIVPLTADVFRRVSEVPPHDRHELAVTLLRVSRGWVFRSPSFIAGLEVVKSIGRKSESHENETWNYWVKRGAVINVNPSSHVSGVTSTDSEVGRVRGVYDALLGRYKHHDSSSYFMNEINEVYKASKENAELTNESMLAIPLIQLNRMAQNASSNFMFSPREQRSAMQSLLNQPFWRLYASFIHSKLMNKESQWDAEIVMEETYLIAGASYATAVLIPKGMESNFHAIQKVSGANIHKTLPSALSVLRDQTLITK